MIETLFKLSYLKLVLALTAALVVGALVTPPDPLSMLLVGLPLWAAYVVACLAVQGWSRRTSSGRQDKLPGKDDGQTQ